MISPLLANIYLHVLDRIWKVKKVEERFKARLIRYAEDVVVLCQGQTERVLKGIKGVLRDLELSLNEDKTRVIDAKKQRFDFLGFTLEVRKNPKTGRWFPLITPLKEAMAKIKAEIKAVTCRNNLKLPKEVLIEKLNGLVRGWVGYFYYGNCSRDLTKLKEFLDERVRIYLRRKHAKKSRGYKVYPTDIFMTILDCIRYRRLLRGLGLRKLLEEDDRKALPTGRQAYSGAKLDRRETN